MGCLKLTYQPTLKVVSRTSKSVALARGKSCAGVYQYKYNSKEWQDELGLNVTAMDFRMYGNDIGRFYNIDPVADLQPSWSPNRFGYNNPVFWKDPTGLTEDCPECPKGYDLDEVVVTAQRTKPSEYASMPNYFPTYFLDKGAKNRTVFDGTIDEYNRTYNTNFYGSRARDQYYYKYFYKPFKQELLAAIFNAQMKAGLAVMTVVGSVAAAPVVAASPALGSVSSVLANPTVQTALANSTIHAGLQYTITGSVDLADAAIAGVPGGTGVQALKPAGMALFNYNFNDGLKTTFNGSKNISSTLRDATTGYIMFGLGFGVTPNNSLNSFNQIPLNGVLNGGDISMGKMLDYEGWK
jgi:RHS repeat-associated protein